MSDNIKRVAYISFNGIRISIMQTQVPPVDNMMNVLLSTDAIQNFIGTDDVTYIDKHKIPEGFASNNNVRIYDPSQEVETQTDELQNKNIIQFICDDIQQLDKNTRVYLFCFHATILRELFEEMARINLCTICIVSNVKYDFLSSQKKPYYSREQYKQPPQQLKRASKHQQHRGRDSVANSQTSYDKFLIKYVKSRNCDGIVSLKNECFFIKNIVVSLPPSDQLADNKFYMLSTDYDEVHHSDVCDMLLASSNVRYSLYINLHDFKYNVYGPSDWKARCNPIDLVKFEKVHHLQLLPYSKV